MQHPDRFDQVISVVLLVILILNNAAGLYLGQAEALFEYFQLVALVYLFFVHLAVKIDDAAIGANSARTNIVDVVVPLGERNSDIRPLFSFFGEDLDTDVLGNGGLVGVDVAFPIQDHCVGPGAGRIVLQCQVFL